MTTKITWLLVNRDRQWAAHMIWPGDDEARMRAKHAADLPPNRVSVFRAVFSSEAQIKEALERQLAILNSQVPDGY
jgi:hypothetical protein